MLRPRMLGQIFRRTEFAKHLAYRKWRRDFLRWTAEDQQRYDFYSAIIPSGSICFDIGANWGNRTKIFRKLGSTVIAVEPQRACAQALTRFFERDPGVTVVRAACGQRPGSCEIHLGEIDTLATLSGEWMARTTASGRFGRHRWVQTESVQMTTLDSLILRFGTPCFIKIDVEGFEAEVIRGLSVPVACISLEFTPEYPEPLRGALERLNNFGRWEANFCRSETVDFAWHQWLAPAFAMRALEDGGEWGDIYLRLEGTCPSLLAADAMRHGVAQRVGGCVNE